MTQQPELLARAAGHGDREALRDAGGAIGYAALLDRAARAAAALLAAAPDAEGDLAGTPVAFLVAPGRDWVVAEWGIWRAGGIAVPLGLAHPPPELAHVLDDAGARLVVADAAYAGVVGPLAAARGLPLLLTGALEAGPAGAPLPPVDPGRGALLLYTSGTTGRPKGVLTTHGILAAQIRAVVEAWEIGPGDRLLHALPLHHLHGILNALACPLWAGGAVELLPRFDAAAVWGRLEAARDLTLFMGVPTMYARLAVAWEAASPERRAAMSAGCARLRLMVSGSAALPVATLARWRALSGHVLLERYGMTEIGMALSNPLHPPEARRPGSVGQPLGAVEVRAVDEAGAPVPDGTPGQLQVRGPGVFAGYWRRPADTRAAFTDDGWFRTGDVAVLEGGAWRLLGRESVDILKTGGHKVSALEIEAALGEHPALLECAVVGVEDAEWGQRVAAAVVLRPGAALTLDELRAWGRDRLAPYKLPTLLRIVDELPRNAMGKVDKRAVGAGWGGGPVTL